MGSADGFGFESPKAIRSLAFDGVFLNDLWNFEYDRSRISWCFSGGVIPSARRYIVVIDSSEEPLPSEKARCAKFRAASTYCGSFMRVKA